MAATTTFATVEEAVDDVRAGRFVIVVDDPDRENEGDLVIAAQFATPEAINFMATHARGLICLCLTEERADHLGLRPMPPRGGGGPPGPGAEDRPPGGARGDRFPRVERGGERAPHGNLRGPP